MRAFAITVAGALTVAVAVAGCGDDVPTRSECARALAHVVMLEDIESLTGDAELAREAGKDMVGNPSTTEAEAMEILRRHDAGMLGGGDSVPRLADCRSRRTTAEVQCMLRAITPGDAHACMKPATK